MRNNLFSGARALVLGSHLAMYSYARDLAFTEIDGHPLYHRDVHKMDRQDDNAATRLFSAATLEFVRSHHSDRIGFAVQSKSFKCIASVPRKFYAFIQLCSYGTRYYVSHIVTSSEA